MIVSDRDALADRDFFFENPGRRFRARTGEGGAWLIRRVVSKTEEMHSVGVLLRTFAPGSAAPSDEPDIRKAWWQAAWPELAAATKPRRRRRVG